VIIGSKLILIININSQLLFTSFYIEIVDFVPDRIEVLFNISCSECIISKLEHRIRIGFPSVVHWH